MTAEEYSKAYTRMQNRMFQWMNRLSDLEQEYRKQVPFRCGTCVRIRFKNRRFLAGIVGSWEINHSTGEFRPNIYKRNDNGTRGKQLYYPWDWEITSIKVVEPKTQTT